MSEQEKAIEFTKSLVENEEIDLETKVNMVVGLSGDTLPDELKKLALMKHIGMKQPSPIEDFGCFVLRCVRPDFFEHNG